MRSVGWRWDVVGIPRFTKHWTVSTAPHFPCMAIELARLYGWQRNVLLLLSVF